MMIFFIQLLFFFYIVMIISFYYGWKKIQPFNSEVRSKKLTVSVVLAVRNEEDNINRLIKNLRLKIKNEPIIAGIIKLIIQRRNVDDKIPITLDENFINTSSAIEPLTPISAIVIVGVSVIKKKTNMIDNTAS